MPRTSTTRAPERQRKRTPEGSPQGRGLILPSRPPLHVPPSTHHHHHLRCHSGSRSTPTVSLVETLVIEPRSTNALAAAQRGVAGSDDSVLGQSTRDSPSRWHWPTRSSTWRRNGGACVPILEGKFGNGPEATSTHCFITFVLLHSKSPCISGPRKGGADATMHFCFASSMLHFAVCRQLRTETPRPRWHLPPAPNSSNTVHTRRQEFPPARPIPLTIAHIVADFSSTSHFLGHA